MIVFDEYVGQFGHERIHRIKVKCPYCKLTYMLYFYVGQFIFEKTPNTHMIYYGDVCCPYCDCE